MWVEAMVHTWADKWATLLQCTNECNISVDEVLKTVGRKLVDAASDVYLFLCTGSAPLLLANLNQR
jgi:hypothetical protein